MDGYDSEKVAQSWEKLLDPQQLRSNLLLASLYLSAYEILKESLIDRIRSFFTLSLEENSKPVLDDQYREVKQLHKSILLASCSWLEQNDALSKDDVDEITAIRQHRNEIAHELPHFLGDIDREISLEHLQGIFRILRKTEIWWVRNVDMAINPEFDNVQVDDEDIHSGPVVLLSEIIRIALAEDAS